MLLAEVSNSQGQIGGQIWHVDVPSNDLAGFHVDHFGGRFFELGFFVKFYGSDDSDWDPEDRTFRSIFEVETLDFSVEAAFFW